MTIQEILDGWKRESPSGLYSMPTLRELTLIAALEVAVDGMDTFYTPSVAECYKAKILAALQGEKP